MLETIIALAISITPYILIGLGLLGVWLLFARTTGKFVASGIKAVQVGSS